ncbi:MAG: hypothetical protein HY925_05285, partial [Elusimicrobia bacterium]|nr:hypothetical protein [Elusimicrobiota bacterium]
ETTREQLVGATWIFWLLLGMPAFALLFGGAAGAQLAGDTARSAETLLPVRASRRAWAYAWSGAANTALLGALVLAAALLVLPKDGDTLQAPFRSWTHWFPDSLASYPVGFAGTLAYMLLVSLVVAYASGSGLLGGLVGALFGGLCFWGVMGGLTLNQLHGARVSFLGWGAAAWLAGMGGACSALSETARRLERREKTGWAALGRIALSAAAGGLLLGGITLWKEREVRQATRMIAPADYPSTRAPLSFRPLDGALLQTVSGSLVWAAPDGSRSELYRGHESGFSLPQWLNTEYQFDGKGVLWVLLPYDRGHLGYELWSGRPPKKLALKGRFTAPGWAYIVRRGAEIGLWTWEGDYVPVEEVSGPNPKWTRKSLDAPSSVELFGRAAYDSGLAGLRDFEKGTVTQRLPGGKTRTWRLSPPSITKAKSIPFTVEGAYLGTEFVIPVSVREGDHKAVKLLRADGSVQEAWRTNSSAAPYPVFAGGLWGFGEDGRSIAWVTRQGRALGPVKAPFKTREVRAIRADGERLWTAANGELWILDGASKTGSKVVDLPPIVDRPNKWDYWMPATPAKKGFFWHTGVALYFVGWDGAIKEIGR